VRIGSDAGLRDRELSIERAVEFRVEHLLNLLVIAIDREANQAIENLHNRVLHRHDQIAFSGPRIHRRGRRSDQQTVPMNIRGDAEIVARCADVDILGGEAAADWHVAQAAAQLCQRCFRYFDIRGLRGCLLNR